MPALDLMPSVTICPAAIMFKKRINLSHADKWFLAVPIAKEAASSFSSSRKLLPYSLSSLPALRQPYQFETAPC
jgi:hypothetical protein